MLLTTPNKPISNRVTKKQPNENHFDEEELKRLLSPYFRIRTFTTIKTFFPVLCSRYKLFQMLRFFVYEVLRLRGILENPFRGCKNGLYFVVLGQRKYQIHGENEQQAGLAKCDSKGLLCGMPRRPRPCEWLRRLHSSGWYYCAFLISKHHFVLGLGQI